MSFLNILTNHLQRPAHTLCVISDDSTEGCTTLSCTQLEVIKGKVINKLLAWDE